MKHSKTQAVTIQKLLDKVSAYEVALNRINNLDHHDSDEANEWAEAEYYWKAKAIASTTLNIVKKRAQA